MAGGPRRTVHCYMQEDCTVKVGAEVVPGFEHTVLGCRWSGKVAGNESMEKKTGIEMQRQDSTGSHSRRMLRLDSKAYWLLHP